MDVGIAVLADLLDAFLVGQYLLKETCNHAESCGDKGANTIRRLWSNVQSNLTTVEGGVRDPLYWQG